MKGLVLASLFLASIGGRSSWTAPWYDGRGAECEVRRYGRTLVELCEIGGRLASVHCTDAESGESAVCPGDVESLIWRQEVGR